MSNEHTVNNCHNYSSHVPFLFVETNKQVMYTQHPLVHWPIIIQRDKL